MQCFILLVQRNELSTDNDGWTDGRKERCTSISHTAINRSKKPLKGQNFCERTENLSFHR